MEHHLLSSDLPVNEHTDKENESEIINCIHTVTELSDKELNDQADANPTIQARDIHSKVRETQYRRLLSISGKRFIART